MGTDIDNEEFDQRDYSRFGERLGTVAQAAASVRRPPASVLLPGGGEPRGTGDD